MTSQKISIRTRLIVAYMSIILIGFGTIMIIAGSQIAVAGRADYEEQFVRSSRLIAQGLRPMIEQESDVLESPSEDLLNTIALYEADTNINIEIGNLNRSRGEETLEQLGQSISSISSNRMVVLSEDANGNRQLFTTAIVSDINRRGGRPENPPDEVESESNVLGPHIYLIFSVPYEDLQVVIAQRWATLITLFLLVSILTIIASIGVAQSIVRPLKALRDTAVLLAHGDFSHRIKHITNDEIGEVSQAFNDMANQVESMLDEQRAFASNTSHELRTPLTTIRLRSEALRYDALDEEIQQRYIEEIDNEVIRMHSLIEDLTLLSKLDANRAELGNTQIDMRRFAKGLLERFNQMATEKNIDLTLEIQNELP
ncbi:MAG: histidine kinase dimerization/phospho-acceptor domain-containing protein, partial [Chloroflexota bacterium]